MADEARIDDVAAAGLASAAAVVERMLELGRAAASGIRLPLPANSEQALAAFGFPGVGGNGSAPDGGGNHEDGERDEGGEAVDPAERARQARRFRADAERLVELYADWTRLLVDGAASIAEQAAGMAPAAAGPGPSAGGDVLVLGPASAKATTTASAWLHVLDGPSAAPAALHATDLVAHDGSVVPAIAVGTTPTHLETSDARSTSEVRVTVVVPEGTAPGSYHGHLLATGLPEVVLPLRLEVVA